MGRSLLQVHTELSRDSTVTLAQLAPWAREREVDTVVVTEHYEHIGHATDWRAHQDRATVISEEYGLTILLGVEVETNEGLHVLLLPRERALTPLPVLSDRPTLDILRQATKDRWLLILAHASRYLRLVTEHVHDVERHLDGMEVWNAKYDGWFPSPRAIAVFAEIKSRQPDFVALAGVDMHRFGRPVVWCEHAGDFLQAVCNGQITLRSHFYRWSAPNVPADIGSGLLIGARFGNELYRGSRHLYRLIRNTGALLSKIGRVK